MPNWTLNCIKIEGEARDIREFLAAVRSQDKIFDFNRLIPMPELLKRTGTGYEIIDGKKVTSWYVVREASLESPEEVRAFTPEEEAVLRDIGYSNWYDWANANWGTKWNAGEASLEGESPIERGWAEVVFHTAWCAPEPVLRKMIAMFPGLKFTCHWSDEGDPYLYSLNIDSDGDL